MTNNVPQSPKSKVTRDDIDRCLEGALQHLDLLLSDNDKPLPSETIIRETADTVASYLVRLKFNAWVRGLEGAEPVPFSALSAQALAREGKHLKPVEDK
jgi:hypothetical protein